MTRPDHGRTIASTTTGMGAPQRRTPDGQVVGYGMGAGAAQHGGASRPQAAYAPQQDYARYAQAQYVAPATSQPAQPPQRKKKRRAAFWIGLIAAILCVVLIILLALTFCSGKSARQGSLGQVEGKSDAEIQAELDRVVDEGMFNISIAASVVFENGSAPGELRIENVPGNHYLMKVDIVRDDTGELIYTTDMIEPNHHIQTDTLDVSLPAGYYDCTATFYAFDMETEDPVGQAVAKIVVQVAS